MPFEKFEKSTGNGPRISLRKSGSIGLNAPAINEHFSNQSWVVLYYDSENRRVGLEPKSEKSKDTYTVQKRDGTKHGGSIHAKAFMREYELIPNKTKQYKAHQDEETGLVYIDASNPILTYESS